MSIGFDAAEYKHRQSECIRERIEALGGKLYLEFGGKLFDDYHASRVLPGFQPDSKIAMLCELRDQAEIIIVIRVADIEKNKMRGDLSITYDMDVLRLIDVFRARGLLVNSVVLTQFAEQPAALAYQKKLEALGLRVYKHYPISGYPSNLHTIISDEGFGRNEYIETSRSLVVVTAPGPGGGKMATCLSQLYHEQKRGVQAGYAKFETFPIWNLDLNHPVNLAYEAATADLNDINMLDPFHLSAYGKTAVNYNRDIEVFPVLKAMLERLSGVCPYRSPTDMGVNMAGYCINNNEIVCDAAKKEIIRRYYQALCALKRGEGTELTVQKLELLMERAGVSPKDRKVVNAANTKAVEAGTSAAAIELLDGTIVCGKTSSLLCGASALLLNALKVLGHVDDSIDLISPAVIEPIIELKTKYLGNPSPHLHLDETLIALSCAATRSKEAFAAYSCLKDLAGLEVHSSVMLEQVDAKIFRKLGVNLTCEPVFEDRKLFHT